MSKQDRTYTRTAAEMEQKYNFGKTFAEVFGMAADAQRAAEKAQQAADDATDAVEGLDQETIFNLLTNYGEIKGLFMKDGQLYINASYLVTGVIKSENGKLVIDLSGESEPTFNTGISTNGLRVRADEANLSGFIRIETLRRTGADGNAVYVPNFEMYRKSGSRMFTIAEDEYFDACELSSADLNRRVVLQVGDGLRSGVVLSNTLGSDGEFVIDEDGETHLTIEKINGKTVSWKDNGDGTFTLIGR